MASIPEYEALRLKEMVQTRNALNRVLMLARGKVESRQDKLSFAIVNKLLRLYEEEISSIPKEERCGESGERGTIFCARKKGHSGMHASVYSKKNPIKLQAIFPADNEAIDES